MHETLFKEVERDVNQGDFEAIDLLLGSKHVFAVKGRAWKRQHTYRTGIAFESASCSIPRDMIRNARRTNGG